MVIPDGIALNENVVAISVSHDKVGRTQKHNLSAVEGKVQPTDSVYFRRVTMS